MKIVMIVCAILIYFIVVILMILLLNKIDYFCIRQENEVDMVYGFLGIIWPLVLVVLAVLVVVLVPFKVADKINKHLKV